VHDPEIYGGRVAYFRSPKFSGEVTVFASGKMISVGGKSEAEASRALELAKEYLIKRGFVKQANLEKKTQNIVVVVDFGHRIDLEALAKDHRMVYEPEQFPGGILRMGKHLGVTALVYSSGKAVIAGIKSRGARENSLRSRPSDGSLFGVQSRIKMLLLAISSSS
jgi:transcription initiation factor TFIID TATA-box-binding protein